MAMQQDTHETYSRDEPVVRGSERSFGFVMAAALALLGSLNWWHAGHVWPWMGGISAAFLVAALLCPVVLAPMNWLWFKFGLLLHAVINPVVMGAIYYFAVLPTGLVMRALGKDLLHLQREPDRDSYWIARGSPAPETMKDQF